MKKLRTLLWISVFIVLVSCNAQTKKLEQKTKETKVDYLSETKEAFNERMAWWRDAGFGLFIHWGPYAVPAGIHEGKETDHIGEWIMNDLQIPISEYEEYSKQFDPQKFDADSWAKTMKDAGVKYVVITSKHHDGFALWDSKVSKYDIVDFSPYGKDILKALSIACKKGGIKFGLYHSISDWHHPKAQGKNYPNYDVRDSVRLNPEFPEYVQEYLKPQLKELVENYDPEIIWFDGEWIPDYTHEMGLDIYQFLRELKPGIIINNRVDKGRQGMQGMNDPDGKFIGDFGTPEQEILESAADVDWEACMTMNDTWGFKTNDHNWKSAELLIHHLVDVAAKGGNYLLNVGPTAEGLIPESSIERLNEIGKWLNVNGEAIYDTRKWENSPEVTPETTTYFTRRGNDLYVILTNWQDKAFVINNIAKAGAVSMLGFNGKVNFSGSGNNLSIIPPILSPETNPCKYAWVYKIKGAL